MERFDKLYNEYAAAIYRYARSCVDRAEVAEEIVSDTFLTLFQKLDTVEDSQLPAWLLTIAKRRAADYWRRSFVESRRLAELDENSAQSEAGIPLSLWLDRNQQLKPIHRSCLILRYAQGMTRDEIAERLGLSETQVKGHLQYALQLLRKDFEVPDARGER